MRNRNFSRATSTALLICGPIAFVGCGGGSGSSSPTPVPTTVPTPAPTAGPAITRDFSADIEGLAISSQRSPEFAGALLAGKGGAGINWYFANLGLLPIVTTSNRTVVRGHLDAYLAKVSLTTGTISDYSNISPVTPRRSDSDDSYISTLLNLASKYRRVTGDNAWWTTNKPKLKTVAQLVLLNRQKSSGLIQVRVSNDVSGSTTGYLMDNCENYGGLNAFATELRKDGDSDATKYANAATKVASGILGLFNGRFFAQADANGDGTFYPLRIAQVFPELYDVPLGTTAQTKAIYDTAWNYMNASNLDWANGQDDGSKKGFPYMVLGAVAAKRGQKGTAQAQLKYYIANLSDPNFTTVQEMGFAQQLQNLLK